MHKWNVYKGFETASKAAADFLAGNINEFIQKKDVCHIALSGGNTPALCLNNLATKLVSWEKVHWYLADERCYPKGHPERNDLMLHNNLWSLIAVANIHAIPAELGASLAAEKYSEVISNISLDIAFLGVGEDGHTASLFPGNAALLDTHPVVPVFDSPKPPSERVSLSLNVLRKIPCRLVLASGAGKEPIISRIISGESLPINGVGDITWFVDEAALPSIP